MLILHQEHLQKIIFLERKFVVWNILKTIYNVLKTEIRTENTIV